MSAKGTVIVVFACLLLAGALLLLAGSFGKQGGVKTFSGAHFVQEEGRVSEHTAAFARDDPGRAFG